MNQVNSNMKPLSQPMRKLLWFLAGNVAILNAKGTGCVVNGMKFDARTLFALQRRGLVALQGSVYVLAEEATERKNLLNEIHQVRNSLNVDMHEVHKQQNEWVGTESCAYMDLEQLAEVLEGWTLVTPPTLPVLDPAEYSDEVLAAQFDFLN